MNKNFLLIILVVFVSICISCQSSSVRKNSAPLPSFYVNAKGDDNNDGLSEKAPFKTLTKAITSAADSIIKIITVIGTLNAESENSSYESEALFLIDLETSEQITIRGKHNATENEKALLDASGCEHKVFTIGGSSNIRFEHIGITGGTSNRGGGAVRMEGDNPVLTIGEGTSIFNNIAVLSGGGIALVNGKLLIEGGVISGNIAGEETSGGGVLIGEDAEFIMSGGEISNNQAAGGGGVCIAGIGTMNNGTILNNIARVGGGIYLRNNAEFILTNGKISGNSANVGGGIHMEEETNFTINNGHIIENKAEWAGGIIVINSKLTLLNGHISDNYAENQAGGVYVSSESEFKMLGGNIRNNIAELGGGGVRIQDGKFIMEGGTINGNKCITEQSSGGGIFILKEAEFTMTNGEIKDNEAGYGGGIENRGNLIIINGNISSNHAKYTGGGIESEGNLVIKNANISNNSAEKEGGGIVVRSGTFLMENGIISDNKCGDEHNGGGVNVWENAEFNMHGGEIINNKAGYSGGGIFNQGRLVIRNGKISNNYAEIGGGIYIDSFSQINGVYIANNYAEVGGGIALGDKVELTNCTIIDNYAKKNGGGIMVYIEGGHLIMHGGTVSGNYSNNGGGAFRLDGPTELYSVKIFSNQSYTGGGILSNTNLLLQDCIIYSNKAFHGGGLNLTGHHYSSRIINCDINNNFAYVYGAAIFISGGTTTLDSSRINGNKAMKGGGFSLSSGSTLFINGGSITQNTANQGNDLYNEKGVHLQLRNIDNALDIYEEY